MGLCQYGLGLYGHESKSAVIYLAELNNLLEG
jgi:hypothetical protein